MGMAIIKIPLFKMNNGDNQFSSDNFFYTIEDGVCFVNIIKNFIGDYQPETPRVSDYLIELNKLILSKYLTDNNNITVRRIVNKLISIFEHYRTIIYFETLDQNGINNDFYYYSAKRQIRKYLNKIERYVNEENYQKNCVDLIVYYYGRLK